MTFHMAKCQLPHLAENEVVRTQIKINHKIFGERLNSLAECVMCVTRKR